MVLEMFGAAGVGAGVTIIGQAIQGWRERSSRERQSLRDVEAAKLQLATKLVELDMERARIARADGLGYKMDAPARIILKHMVALDEISESRTWKRGDELDAERQKAIAEGETAVKSE